MEPVLLQSKQIHYVSEADMVRFVSQNAPMEWNEACKFIRNKGLTSDEGEKVYWTKESIHKPDAKKYHNEDQLKWIVAFFDAHPWIERMMVVFDD
jgi:hypothetical protein